MAVSFAFLGFRICVRLKFFRRLYIDDALVIAAWLMTVANAAIWQAAIEPLYLTVAITSGQVAMPPPDYVTTTFFVYTHSQFATIVLYYTSLYTIKLSFLFFFRILGDKVRRQQIIWWSALAFVVAAYLITFSLLDFKCLVGPKSKAIGKLHILQLAHQRSLFKPNARVLVPLAISTIPYELRRPLTS